MIAVIRATYNGVKCHVLHYGKISLEFEIGSEVRHGYILLPIFFLLVIGYIFYAESAEGCGRIQHLSLNISTSVVNDFLLSHQIMDFGQMTLDLKKEKSRVGLMVNTNKTNVLNLSGHRTLPTCINRQNIEGVKKLCISRKVTSADDGNSAFLFFQNLEKQLSQR